MIKSRQLLNSSVNSELSILLSTIADNSKRNHQVNTMYGITTALDESTEPQAGNHNLTLLTFSKSSLLLGSNYNNVHLMFIYSIHYDM